VTGTVPDSHDVVEHPVLLGTEPREAIVRAGDTVRLVEGPLAGLEAVFECTEGDEHAIVLLEFLQCSQRVIVSARSRPLTVNMYRVRVPGSRTRYTNGASPRPASAIRARDRRRHFLLQFVVDAAPLLRHPSFTR
jgi:hypothetical protein